MLDKITSSFTDFRLWITNIIYDILRINKPTLVSEVNLTFTSSQTDYEITQRGNVLQIDGISGNNTFYIKFNEKESPSYRVIGKSTFRIPFYRFFITCDHYGGLVASQIRIKTNPNCSYDALNTVDLAGANTDILIGFETLATSQWTVPAGGYVDIDFGVLFNTTKKMWVRYLELYNTDMSQELVLKIPSVIANGVSFFPTEKKVFNFSGGGWKVRGNEVSGRSIRVENSGASDVVIQSIIGVAIDSSFT